VPAPGTRGLRSSVGQAPELTVLGFIANLEGHGGVCRGPGNGQALALPLLDEAGSGDYDPRGPTRTAPRDCDGNPGARFGNLRVEAHPLAVHHLVRLIAEPGEVPSLRVGSAALLQGERSTFVGPAGNLNAIAVVDVALHKEVGPVDCRWRKCNRGTGRTRGKDRKGSRRQGPNSDENYQQPTFHRFPVFPREVTDRSSASGNGEPVVTVPQEVLRHRRPSGVLSPRTVPGGQSCLTTRAGGTTRERSPLLRDLGGALGSSAPCDPPMI
jgi:hypothetical protein